MSHSLAQKANQNYQKEYAKLKRQSLNQLTYPKQDTLHTEEDVRQNDQNYFDIQKEGVPLGKQAQDKLKIIISDQGDQVTPVSNAYGFQTAVSSQNSQDQQNNSNQGISTPINEELKVKPKTKQMTRTSFQAQVPYYQQKAEEKKDFKSYERDDNPFLNPLIQKVNNLELKGSMHVIDLWEDKALKKYLNYSNLKDGKYMLRGIAQQINQDQLQQKKDVPTIFTKKDEFILQGKLQDKESMNNYIKHINEEYVKNQKLLDIKIQKSGLSQAISRQSIILPAETNFQQILPSKRNSQTKIDQEKQFDDIEFIKNFFQRTQSQASISSPQKFQSQLLSPNKIYQNNKIKTSPSASPQKQEKKHIQNYFFPSQTLQSQVFEQSAGNQRNEDFTQLSDIKSQFLQVPSMNFESPNKQISKNILFNSEPQQNKLGQVQNNSYNQLFSPNNKLINTSDLNSTNFLSQMKKNENSKVSQFSSRIEKREKQFTKIGSAKLNNFKNTLNNQKIHVDNFQSGNKILKTEDLNISQRNSFYNPKLNVENKMTEQIEQQKILEKINSMFKQIDSIQKSDLNQKKQNLVRFLFYLKMKNQHFQNRKIDDLIEKIQDRVIVSIQNQKKKILDNDRINNLSNDAQK